MPEPIEDDENEEDVNEEAEPQNMSIRERYLQMQKQAENTQAKNMRNRWLNDDEGGGNQPPPRESGGQGGGN